MSDKSYKSADKSASAARGKRTRRLPHEDPRAEVGEMSVSVPWNSSLTLRHDRRLRRLSLLQRRHLSPMNHAPHDSLWRRYICMFSSILVSFRIITHAGSISDEWSRLISGVFYFFSVCVCVRIPKGKRLELSTPNSVDTHTASARQSLGMR